MAPPPQLGELSQGMSLGMSQLHSDNLRQSFAAARDPAQQEGGSDAGDHSSYQTQLGVVQPQVQHVVIRVVAKMRVLVRRKRTESGQMMCLSSQLDRRLSLRACLSTWVSISSRCE